jgi:hypothetical protein
MIETPIEARSGASWWPFQEDTCNAFARQKSRLGRFRRIGCIDRTCFLAPLVQGRARLLTGGITNDSNRIGSLLLAVRQSDLHLVSAKRGQRHLAAWFKDLARHQTRSEMWESSAACGPPVTKSARRALLDSSLFGGCCRHEPPRQREGGREGAGRMKLVLVRRMAAWGWVRSHSWVCEGGGEAPPPAEQHASLGLAGPCWASLGACRPPWAMA